MRRFKLILLIVLGAMAWTLSVHAQQQTPVIGLLSSGSSALRTRDQFTAFHAGLKEAGYVDKENVHIEYRWANDDYAQLPALAEELVRLRVKVLVAAGGQVSALAAQKATKEIPIVFTTVADPVKSGLVASLNRPGGNATGTAGLTSELDPKRLELLHLLKPTAKLMGVLADPKRPGLTYQLQNLHSAAAKLSVELDVREAATEDEIDTAFEKKPRIEGLLVTADPYFNSRRSQLIELAERFRIPAIYQWREFVAAGGLMSYGPSITEAYHQAGINSGRILNGAKPAEIPVVQPIKFGLSINLKTSKALSIEVPPTLLARADEVIE